MKDINIYINEALNINHDIASKFKGHTMYTVHPSTTDELRKIINRRLKENPDADLNDIDVSKITDMSLLFYGFKPHNIKIDEWDVSNVENMYGVFQGCVDFNCDLSNWDVSNVTDMNGMFYCCRKFDSDISKWNISNVKNMKTMLYGCWSFNSDLSNWNIDKNTVDTLGMFDGCKGLNDFPSWYKE